MANNIPVAFAVTYLVGVIGRGVGPVAARSEADARRPRRGVPEARGADAGGRAGWPLPVRREFELRAYAVDPGSPWVGRARRRRSSAAAGGERIFVERIRSGGQVHEGDAALRCRPATSSRCPGGARRWSKSLEQPGSGLREVDDKELLDLPGDIVDVVVTNAAIDGRTLAELGRGGSGARRVPEAHHARRRAARHLPATKVQRGDVLTIVGSAANVARAVELIGVADRATDVTDMFVVATAHRRRRADRPSRAAHRQRRDRSQPAGRRAAGRTGLRLAALGQAALVRPHSRAHALGLRVDRARPGFVAVVGLNAGPDFVRGLQTSGLSLVVAGALTITIPLLIGVLVGRWVFKMHPGVLLGVCRRRLHGDAGARGRAGGGEERGAVDRLRRRVRRRQRAARDLGHGHRRDARLT